MIVSYKIVDKSIAPLATKQRLSVITLMRTLLRLLQNYECQLLDSCEWCGPEHCYISYKNNIASYQTVGENIARAQQLQDHKCQVQDCYREHYNKSYNIV